MTKHISFFSRNTFQKDISTRKKEGRGKKREEGGNSEEYMKQPPAPKLQSLNFPNIPQSEKVLRPETGFMDYKILVLSLKKELILKTCGLSKTVS